MTSRDAARTAPLLEAKEVTKRFGGLSVLDGVSLSVPPGARQALIGPNGAGKTTLLNILNGLLAPTSGRVMFGGSDVTRMPIHRRAAAGIGRTFQVASLFNDLSIADNVRLALLAKSEHTFSALRPLDTYEDLNGEVARLLAVWGLADRQEHLVAEVSYGERRILELVLAAAGQPAVILLDEPAAGLSTEETKRILGALESLDPSVAVLMVEHDMEVVFSTCNHVTVLAGGHFLCEGTPAEVRSSEAVASAYLGVKL